MLLEFTDCFADSPSSSVQTREASSTCCANSNLTSFPDNNSTPNHDNGHCTSNMLVLDYFSAQDSNHVQVLHHCGYMLVLNNDNSNELPLMLLNGAEPKTELLTSVNENIEFIQVTNNNLGKDVIGTVTLTSQHERFSDLACTASVSNDGHCYYKDVDSIDYLATEIPSPASNTTLPLLTDNCTSNKNESPRSSLDGYNDACVMSAHLPVGVFDPSSKRTTLSFGNLKEMTPHMKGHVEGSSLQPAAYAEHNSVISKSHHCSNSSRFSVLSNHSSEPERSVSFQFPIDNYSYRCPHCSQRFGTENAYRLHIHIHEKKCPYCMEVFSSTSGRSYRNLLKHVVLYHKDKDPCIVAHRRTIESALRGME